MFDLMEHASQYYQNLPSASSIPARLAAYQRRRMFDRFADIFGIDPQKTIADIGVTSNETYKMDNYFEVLYPHKQAITAVGLEDASHLEKRYPGLRFVQVTLGPLPFENGEFDIAHSSAVIEHVGSRQNQESFLRELWRVARRGIFVTTPNRWFPIEFHTMLPFAHWLPQPVFRKMLGKTGQYFYSQETNLNLMSKGDLRNLARGAGITEFRIETMRLGPWPSNLLLIAIKSN
jgi:ubiquinone/menaquinone biosynthesis C-methylase UbiE